MTNNRKIILWTSLFFLLFPLSAGPSNAQPDSADSPDEIILHLKWKHAFQFAGFYAAQTQGYYKAANLNVTIKESSIGDTPLDAVLSGQAQYGVWGPNLLNHRLEGSPVVILGTVFQHSAYGVISLKSTGIRAPGDLVGKTVAVESGMGLAQLQAMLLHEGVPLSQVNIVPHDWNLDNLMHGKVDAEFSYITDQPNQISMRGEQPATLQPINYGIDFYGDCLFTTEDQISKHPNQVRAMRQASFQGWQYAMEHPDEMIDYILKLPGVAQRGLNRQHLEFEARHMEPLLQPKFIQPGHTNPGRWERMADLQVQLGIIEPGYSLDGFIYDPNLPEDSVWIKPLLTGLTLAILLAFIVAFWNMQMRRTINQRTAELHQSEQQLRSLFENAPIGLWLEDFSLIKARFEELRQLGTTNFPLYFQEHPEELSHLYQLIKVVDVNLEAVRLHRAANKNDLKNSLTETFTEESFAVFQEEMIALAAGQQTFESDALVHTIDGQKVHVFLRLVLGGDHDDWSKTYLAMMDISERKKAEKNNLEIERQIQHGQKLESMGILAGGIAHDFNNLLMAILGNADLALSDLSPTAPVRPFIHEIHATSRRAANLCQQMLAYSGKGQFEIKTIDLTELTMEMTHLLKSIIPKKVNFRQELASPGPVIEADVAQLQQVVMNLITNAAEAIGDAMGTVTIVTEIRDCDASFLQKSRLADPPKPGRFACLKVSDDGEGMNPETLDKLFDPFFTTKFTGRGLGLSAVLGIIRGHKGALIVESSRGVGTTFDVLFPLVESSALEPASQEDQSSSTTSWQGKGLVLMVDDEESVRTVAGRMLKKMGFEVLEAEDGLQAVEVYKTNADAISFIVLDLTMPLLSGEEAFTRIREINPRVPVLMASGYSKEEFAFQFGTRKGCGFIQKPFTLKRFRQEIQSFLDTQS